MKRDEQLKQLEEARQKATEVNKGNNYSNKINRLMGETLKRVLIQDEAKRARNIAEALVTKAEDGDVHAASVIFDRIDGKVVQENKVSGDSEQPIMIQVVTGIDD